jgi:radical SAM protein with 4Fe4S-binding SPASM domain
MTPYVRRQYLKRAPRLLWDILVRGRHDFIFDLMPMRSVEMDLPKRVNLLKSGMNLLHRRLKPWSMPINFQVEPTNYCNLECPVCACGAGLLTRPRGNMDLNLYRRLMDEIGPYLLNILLWGWGEPLLHPEFPEFVRIARGHGVNPLLSTNGQNLIEERVQEGLLREPPDILIVSVDGLTQDAYNAYRIGADLEKMLAGVRRLAELKRARNQDRPVLNMRMIATKQNERQIGQARDFAVRHQFDMLTIRTMVCIDAGKSAYGRFLPERDDYRSYRYENGRRVQRQDYQCQNAFAFPAMLLDGSVVPCDQDFNAQHSFGRFGNGATFRDIWFSRQAADVRKTIRKDRESYSTCRNCPFADRVASACTIQMHDLRTGRSLTAEPI